MRIRNGTKKGYIDVPQGGAFCMAFPKSKARRGRVIKNGDITPTLDTSCEVGTVKLDGKKLRARRLTPRECFRLQGFSDEQFDNAAKVNDDNALYKQAGNSVTVNVIYEIAKRI